MIGLVMARANLPAKKYKKSNPTQLRLSFEMPANGVSQYIDIAQALSAINRKAYRQGLYYYVNSVEVYNDEQAYVDFLVAPDTWVTKNAWNRGFQLFQKMNSMADEPITGVGRPKYHDFKIRLDANQNVSTVDPLGDGSGTNKAFPSTHGENAILHTHGLSAEWSDSIFVSADSNQDSSGQADQFVTHLVGPHTQGTGSANNVWSSIGLIASYATSRVTVEPETPNSDEVAPQDPLLNIFDFSDEEQMNDIIQNLRDENDEPPYDVSDYLGENYRDLQQVARIGTETGLGRIGRASGFCVPFGLIKIDTDASSRYRVVLNIAPGTYHGVYAERA